MPYQRPGTSRPATEGEVDWAGSAAGEWRDPGLVFIAAGTGKRPPPVDTRRVSVVLPTFNRRESLQRCLEALVACDTGGREVEILVVDDGSSDGSPTLVEELGAGAPPEFRVRCIRQNNAGPSAARNRAIVAADTDLVLFIDDDCVPDRNWIRALVETPWSDGIGGVGGRIEAAGPNSHICRYCRYLGYNEYPPRERRIRFVNSANCAFRRDVLRELGGMELLVSGAGEDQDLSHRVVALGYGLVYQPRAVVQHYHRESLRPLVRSFRTRGYRGTLRRILWNCQAMPSRKRLRREFARLVGCAIAGLRIPAEAVVISRSGVRASDAIVFAALEWLRRLLLQDGKVRMMRDIMAGRQRVQRSSRMPEGPVDRTLLMPAPAGETTG